MEDVNVDDHWFQQDDATCHTANRTIKLLKEAFGHWTTNFVGWVKSLVYTAKPETIDAFLENIRHVIADIRPSLLKKVFENCASRPEVTCPE